MKRYAIVLLMSLVPMWLMSQNYNKMWKEADEASDKDLPKTEQKVLRRIADKALDRKDYGQLLAAELRYSSLAVDISPDSLEPEIRRLTALHDRLGSKDAALKAVLSVVLGRIYEHNNSLGDDHEQTSKNYLAQALANMDALAAHHDSDYQPFVETGKDSEVFGHDLLHVIGNELGCKKQIRDYYLAHGNRRAACVLDLEMAKDDNNLFGDRLLQRYDSQMAAYADVPEVADIAIARYQAMSSLNNKATEKKYQYGEEIIAKWPEWRNMNVVRTSQKQLTAPCFNLWSKRKVVLPGTPAKVELSSLRNIGDLTITLRRLNADGTTALNVGSDDGYSKVAKLIVGNEKPITVSKQYAPRTDREEYKDTLELPGLRPGVYLIEATGDKEGLRPQRDILYVSRLFLMAEQLPGKEMRYVAVDGATGHPVAGAKLRIYTYQGYNKPDIEVSLTTDSKGEAKYKWTDRQPSRAYLFTADDNALPAQSVWASYSYYDNFNNAEKVSVLTDRSIYRPGQTVRVAAIVYEQTGKTSHRVVAGESIKFALRDANNKIVSEQKATTDEFGTATTDFLLPTSGLTGRFTIVAVGRQRGSASVRVEEYKRPTFFVEFDDYKAIYHPGDTIELTGRAKSYAGVPVQGATVKYEVVRSRALWWWRNSDDTKATVGNGEAVTGQNGEFKMRVPLVVPDNGRSSAFYTFTADATVTDQGGESQSGKTSVPLGTRDKVLSCDLPTKQLDEKLTSFRFSLRNASGSEIDGTVSYCFDGGKMQTAKANTEIKLPQPFKSGKHKLVASCEGDTLRQNVEIFSFSDKRPASETHDWFYSEGSTFPTDGKPVRIQIGSSDEDQYILYTIFAEDKELEHGTIRQSNALTTKQYTYREEYGDGITVTFAWVKDQRLYTHSATIMRPLPNKKLKLTWQTFRDRLTPGQQEQWTALVTTPDGKPVNAQLMATLYDKSLDQISRHQWFFSPSLYRVVPSASWGSTSIGSLTLRYCVPVKGQDIYDTEYSTIASHYYQELCRAPRQELMPLRAALGSAPGSKRAVMVRGSAKHAGEVDYLAANYYVVEELNESAATLEKKAIPVAGEEEEGSESGAAQVRENLNETAFFLPQLSTDAKGRVVINFTLPESITTWRFMGLAHDKEVRYGWLDGEAVASKTVMVQPNMPRFVRHHDKAQIAARLMNTSDKAVGGTAQIEILEPTTEKVLHTATLPFTIEAQSTSQVSFPVDATELPQLVIVRMKASGDGFSDGEQHYLPILPDEEMVMNTVPFTQHEAGVKTIDVAKLFPETSSKRKLTVEYTNNPAWFMVQALPFVGDVDADNAMSLAAALYANSIGRNIISSSPRIKRVIEQWQHETGGESTLLSNLQKNAQLKELMLNETPWMLDAEKESDQKQSLIRFFDTNTLNEKCAAAVKKLQQLQLADGSWAWCKGMDGSPWMTGSILTTLVRLNNMAGQQADTEEMMTKGFGFMHQFIDKEVKYLKEAQKKGTKNPRPSELAVQYLYSLAIGNPKLSPTAKANRDYLVGLLSKQTKEFSIYGKAVSAIILAANGHTKKANEYLQSIQEYTVYTEEMGRYFDTPKAGYSWFDYRIPTEVAAIEAFKMLVPGDHQTVEDMQRWLLQSKRTQAWDTPLNSINAIYAFADNSKIDVLDADGAPTVLKLDGKAIDLPTATAGLGYVKTAIESPTASVFTAEKSTPHTSWGAVYAQFMQPMSDIEQASSGLRVKREYFTPDGKAYESGQMALSVGQKIRVRLTIEADRDYDFVQVIDKRAACLEPAAQLSGYHWGCYIAPKDYTTTYYFDRLRKGRHQVEAEYYVDRAGTYLSGTCTAQCAYAPEYTGRAKAVEFNVK